MFELNWKEGCLFTLEEKGTKKTFCYTGRSASVMTPKSFECAALVAWANDFLTRSTSVDHLTALAKNLTENTDNLRQYVGTSSLIKFTKTVAYDGGSISCPEKVKNAILNKDFCINHDYGEKRYFELLQLANVLVEPYSDSIYSFLPSNPKGYRVYKVNLGDKIVWDFKLNSTKINDAYHYNVCSVIKEGQCSFHNNFQVQSSKAFPTFSELKVVLEEQIQNELDQKTTSSKFKRFKDFKRDINHDWRISNASAITHESELDWDSIKI